MMKQKISKIKSMILAPFTYFNKINKGALFLFILINSVVFYNVVSHAPHGIYDVDGHMNLVLEYSEGRLPTKESGREYHSPYLPYLIPAATYRISTNLHLEEVFTLDAHQENILARRIYDRFLDWNEDTNFSIAAKSGQFQMFFVSIGITYLLAIISKKINPENPIFQTISLGTLGFLPVYYRSLSMLRGEPYLALFILSTLLFTMRIYEDKDASRLNIFLAGLSIGFAVLSRHMGIVVGPMVALYGLLLVLTKKIELRYFLKSIFPVGIIAIFLALSFFGPYLYNNDYQLLPDAEAFQNLPHQFSFSNIPSDYFTDLALDRIVTDPIRPQFVNTFFPILYSDTFGDYWGYFLVSGKDLETDDFLDSSTLGDYYYDFLFLEKPFPPEKFNWETNRQVMGTYLGMVNVFSLPVFFMMLYGVFLAIRSFFSLVFKKNKSVSPTQLLMILMLSGNFLMYLYLVIRYGGGDMAKATYIIHIFPLLAILSGYGFTHIQRKNKPISDMLIGSLITIALIKIPTYFTHWSQW